MGIEKFIDLVIDLVYDEYSEKLEIQGARHYLRHGGCFEFALIIKHFYKESILMLKNDFDHWAILYKEKLYDATGEIKDIENYQKATDNDYLYALDRNIDEINVSNGIRLNDNIVNKVKIYYKEQIKRLI